MTYLLFLFSHWVMSDSLWPHALQRVGSSVLYHFPEITQIHVHWVCDALYSSHPLSPPSPLAFSLSQLQGLFQWIGSWHQVVKVLELQQQSFQWSANVHVITRDSSGNRYYAFGLDYPYTFWTRILGLVLSFVYVGSFNSLLRITSLLT